jgi:hypothetical protein
MMHSVSFRNLRVTLARVVPDYFDRFGFAIQRVFRIGVRPARRQAAGMLKLCRFAVERVPTILVDAAGSVIKNYFSRKINVGFCTRRFAGIQN